MRQTMECTINWLSANGMAFSAETGSGHLLTMDGAPDGGGRLLRFEITGTGFLRHMVRIIVGTLVDIGRGQMAVEEMAAIIESRDRRRAGHTAPAHGLMLWKVDY